MRSSAKRKANGDSIVRSEDFDKRLNALLEMSDQCAGESCESLYEQKTVLGIDIYRYSKYELLPQTIIPSLFRRVIYSAVDDLRKYESTFFRDYSDHDFENAFISTGDGGFVILDTPLHALLFAIYLASKLKIYNTGRLSAREYRITGEITYRYAMCFGGVYQLEKNWFGPAIITCARILSVDRLNRFLLDEKTNDWFDQNLNGVETLLSLGMNNLSSNDALKPFLSPEKVGGGKGSLMLPELGNDPGRINSNILNVTVSKIGDLEVKKDTISVYSVHLQVYIVYITFETVQSPEKYVVSVGNLNVAGLEMYGG